MQLKDKTIVLTGATSGIGLEMLDLLARDNRMAVVARDSDRLEHVRDRFPGVKAFAADLSDTEVYAPLAADIVSHNPRIDVLIHNAAVQNTPTLLDPDFDPNAVATEINLNLTAVASLTARLLPALEASGSSAAVVMINSGLAFAPKRQSAVYCATKAALDSLARSFSYQLEGTEVSVLQAFLPLVDTPMTEGRGTGKLEANDAAQRIVTGIERGTRRNLIGKVKILAALMRLVPSVGRSIMKAN